MVAISFSGISMTCPFSCGSLDFAALIGNESKARWVAANGLTEGGRWNDGMAPLPAFDRRAL